MAVQIVPPVPFKAPVTDDNGLLSTAWAGFFRQLFNRIGGPTALSNLELADEQSTGIAGALVSITALQGSVSTLRSTVASQTTDLATLQSSVNDLGQGPVL